MKSKFLFVKIKVAEEKLIFKQQDIPIQMQGRMIGEQLMGEDEGYFRHSRITIRRMNCSSAIQENSGSGF